MARTATIERNTTETKIAVELNLDGVGNADINTGVGFFDHMLDLLARHGALDLTVRANDPDGNPLTLSATSAVPGFAIPDFAAFTDTLI